MVFSNHIFGNEFIEKSTFFGEFPINRFGAGIDESMDVRIELTDTL